MASNHGDVGQFHQKFRLHNTTFEFAGPPPEPITEDLVKFRLKFLEEELLEFARAFKFSLPSPPLTGTSELKIEVDHAQAFDALLDLVYVAMGTAHLLGYPWQEGWDEVQRANMTKMRAETAEQSQASTGRGSTLDVIKPPDFKPPDIAKVLRRNGFPT
jgi:predicted HAD superfamily Cof-like phosphohydrolase